MLTATASAVARAVALISTLISVPFALSYLGAERYGLWMTIVSAISILGFSDLGIGNGVLNSIIEANGQGDRTAAKRAVSSAFFILLGIGVFVLMMFAAIYWTVSWGRVFNVTTKLAMQEAGPAVTACVACFAIGLPLGVVLRVQMGYQEGMKSNLWQCLGTSVALLCLLAGIYLEMSLPWLVLAMAGGPVLALALNWIVEFGQNRPWLSPRWTEFESGTSRKIVLSGSLFLLLQLFSLLGNMTDSIVVAQILGPSTVAEYAVAQKLFSMALLAQIFITPLWPAFGEALVKHEYAWAQNALKNAMTLSLGISVVTAVPLLLFGQIIAGLWVGPHFHVSPSLFVALSFWVLLAGYGGVMSVFLNNKEFLRWQVVLYGIASLAALGLKIPLTHVLGVSGVVWATLIGYGLLYAIPAAILVRRSPVFRKN